MRTSVLAHQHVCVHVHMRGASGVLVHATGTCACMHARSGGGVGDLVDGGVAELTTAVTVRMLPLLLTKQVLVVAHSPAIAQSLH